MTQCNKCPIPNQGIKPEDRCTLYDTITCFMDFLYDNKLIYISNGTTRICIQDELYDVLSRWEKKEQLPAKSEKDGKDKIL
jgi:hypothetical protein